MNTRILIDFPSGLTMGFDVPVVPRVGEFVLDPKTQTELRVARVTHTLADHYSNSVVKIVLSTE